MGNLSVKYSNREVYFKNLKPMEILFIVFVVLWLILSIISLIVINNNTLYSRIFEKKKNMIYFNI